MHANTVDTPRLRLRLHRADDFEACYAIWSDPDVVRFLGGRPLSREEAWARLLRYVGHWTLLGFGMWAVERRDKGEYIGDVGFFDGKREIEPPFGDAPEIGWVLASNAHGKGYATEAVSAAIEWRDARFGRVRTVCIVHPENAASLRVAEKCGYRETHRTTYKNEPAIVMERA
jgi:RimJ/RimL family protein N-acetyltransferase